MTKYCINIPDVSGDGGGGDYSREHASRTHEGAGGKAMYEEYNKKNIKTAQVQAQSQFVGIADTLQTFMAAVESHSNVIDATATLNKAPSGFFAKQYAREDALRAFCQSYKNNERRITEFGVEPGLPISKYIGEDEREQSVNSSGDLINVSQNSAAHWEHKMHKAMADSYTGAVGDYSEILNAYTHNLFAKNVIKDGLFGQTVDGIKGEFQAKYNEFCNPDTGDIQDKYRFREKVAASYTQVADQVKAAGTNRMKAYHSDAATSVDLYTSAFTYKGRLEELLGIRKHENAQLKQALREQQDMTHTDNRKAMYEIEASADMSWVMKALRWTWISLIVLYMLVGPFIPDKQWQLWYAWVIIVCLAGIPWIMQSIAGLLHHTWKTVIWWKENRAPKNVYTEL